MPQSLHGIYRDLNATPPRDGFRAKFLASTSIVCVNTQTLLIIGVSTAFIETSRGGITTATMVHPTLIKTSYNF